MTLLFIFEYFNIRLFASHKILFLQGDMFLNKQSLSLFK